jgi:hypothetical protein
MRKSGANGVVFAKIPEISFRVFSQNFREIFGEIFEKT